MAAADPIPPAILSYVDHGSYPSSEDVASASLDSTSLGNLLESLRNAQNEVENDIRSLSKDTAPDVDEWISKAKSLQQDIQRSRETARHIVAEHESGGDLKASVQDKEEQVRLLEKEVAFEETLGETLEQIKYANGLLQSVQDEAVGGNLESALDRLETSRESVDGLRGVSDTRICALLQGRANQLRDSLAETATVSWKDRISVKDRTLAIKPASTASQQMTLEGITRAARRLDTFDAMLKKLNLDIERNVLKPRLTVNGSDQVAKLEFRDGELCCKGSSDDLSYVALFGDLERLMDFLAKELPPSISIALSSSLTPALADRLEEQWLEPAVPLDVNEMPAFQETLHAVERLADTVDKHDWHGSKQFRDWVQNAPRTWLTKRREAVLGDVRNLVFAGLRETKEVERVETQMVSKHDHQALQGGGGEGDDDWDTAWDEPEGDAGHTETPALHVEKMHDDEDEASAWDIEDTDDTPAPGNASGDDDGDAWGWGDDDANKPASPVTTKQQQQPLTQQTTGKEQPTEREMTLRETFTVTLIPDGIMEILQHIIDDAQTLAGLAYAKSAIAPAAAALYTLPTLALAIYRATAPTAYANLPTGNMLIYNDASQLASKLREWQASQPPASRLRLDADVKALEAFAKKAYSSEMESQRTILRDLLDGAQGFDNVTKPPFKAECEGAVEQTVDRLREVHRQWKGTLSDGALLQSLGSLLATVMGKMISEIEDLGDIGEEDSHQLRKLLDQVSETKDLFAQKSADGQQSQEMTFIYCPNWLKFQYLAEILESSLADIKYLWNEGELSLEFDAEEVCELIEGLFADSDIRRRTMADIRRSRR
ncbi:hypothetical protein B0A50_08005 [Salinomyces thailandicus]|uniref:ZW10 C-terminal helical domain-containing protein n=1 Tax=Salinomyces thailandicus TaxID=706561 RepID=A0A4U0TL70_9PEZI|nr:hypothetical protein B0A50_08005 [Salinomyces thailandica]